MANQHDTPGFHSFKSFSFIFHALISVSIARARHFGILSCEGRNRASFLPDCAAPRSRCYQQSAPCSAAFPQRRTSIARLCMALLRPVICAGAWPWLGDYDRPHSTG